jgi:hypothetical protein
LGIANLHQTVSLTGLNVIVQASNLLETANNLEILNLDAMAEQELAEELQEEEAEEVEDEVVYHEPHNEVADDDPYEAAVQMQPAVQSSGFAPKPTFQSPLRPIREVEQNEMDMEWEDSVHDGELSIPPSAEKRVISADEENATPSKMDSSYSWESVEAMPAKAVKLQLPHSRQAELNAALSSADTAVADGQDQSTAQTTGTTSVASHTVKPNTGNRPSQPAPKVIPVPTAAPSGRKVKPLKPKEKMKKELDFWGVNSKKTINFAALDKNKSAAGGAVPAGPVSGSADASQRAIDSISASLDGVKTGKKEREREPADGFFGTMGLFGDEAYFSDTNETDVESSNSCVARDSGNAGNGAHGSASAPTGVTSSQHAQRLPLGWLSSMVSSTTEGTTSTTAPSFFDDLEAETDDPILRQVEYNRLHPHAAAQERANSASLGGSVSRVLEMWNGFMATDSSAGSSGSGAVGGGGVGAHSGQNSPTPGGTGTGSAGASPSPEVYVAGVGPSWAVQMLTWYAFITGVTVVLTDPAGMVCYSGSRGGSAPVGIIRQQIRNNLAMITLSMLTVTVRYPAEKNTMAMCIFALQICKVVCLTVVSVVLRAVVVVATLLYILVRYIAEYVSGTSFGAAVSNSRLRRFFANESVGAVLGEAPPVERVSVVSACDLCVLQCIRFVFVCIVRWCYVDSLCEQGRHKRV